MGYQTSDIGHQTLCRLTDIRHKKSNIRHHQRSDVVKRTSDVRYWISDIGHRTSHIRHQLSDISRQTSEMGETDLKTML